MTRPPHVPEPPTELEEFFELSIDPLSIIGFDGGFKRVNDAFVRLLGYTNRELFSRSALDILHPDDVEPARAALAELAEGDDVVRFEARVICADGAVRWLEWSTRSMRERGVVYSVGRDTTERRRGEADLREAQRLLETSRDELFVLAAEQAALRRVATLVAQDVPSRELFGAVAAEVGVLLGADLGGMIRYEEDGTVAAVATWAAVGEHPPMPERWQIQPGDPAWLVLENRAAIRVEDWASVPGPFADAVRNDFGVSSSVGCAIVVEGRVWGALAVHSKQSRPLPPDTESRIAQFTDLIGTAIANAEARERANRLRDEQAALRRVATLVARGTGPESVFRAVADEVGALMGCDTAAIVRFEADGWATVMGAHRSRRVPGARFQPEAGYVVASVQSTGRAARFDTDDPAAAGMPDAVRAEGIRSGIAAPILVDGDLWGTITVASLHRSLPVSTERRLADFTELVATAISNSEAQAEIARLAQEQAALRRVATLVAQGTPSDALFRAVCDEVGAVVGAEVSAVVRFEADGTVALMGTNADRHAVGTRLELDPDYIVAQVHRTGRAARFDTDDPAAPGTPELAREEGVRSGLASPIVVAGELWGAISAGSRERRLAAGMERRLADFTELVATAISNTQARAEVERLAAEQAALRRVATLVARGAEPAAVFDAVAAEMEGLLGADQVSLGRYEPGDEVTVVADRGKGASHLQLGSRFRLPDQSATTTVRRTGRPARIEDYAWAEGPIAAIVRVNGLRVTVGAPIVVDGALWGAITASWARAGPPPDDTEGRMARFAELLDTAIANADSRDQLAASRARLLTAGDEARRRVVRDLHDGAQQGLVHTIVALKLAQRALRERDDRADSLVAEALSHAEKGNVDLRELAHGILPAVLTRGGLRAAVRALTSRLDLPVELDVTGERVRADVEASAYFVVAEALTNVTKHADARRTGVRASVVAGALRVEIVDDGAGGADPSGHGLVGIADRVTALGGRLDVESPSAGGTHVTATFPLRVEA